MLLTVLYNTPGQAVFMVLTGVLDVYLCPPCLLQCIPADHNWQSLQVQRAGVPMLCS